MKTFTAIILTWLFCLAAGAANADVIMQDMSDQQWRNSQYQAQEYERREAEALEQANRIEQQRLEIEQQNQLNQSSPYYLGVEQ